MQSSSQIIATNKPTSIFTGQMPSLSPTSGVRVLKGCVSRSMDLLTPSSPGSLRTLSLTISSYWLPWGGLPFLRASALWFQYPREQQCCWFIMIYSNFVTCRWCRPICRTSECMRTLHHWLRRRLSAVDDVVTVVAVPCCEDSFPRDVKTSLITGREMLLCQRRCQCFCLSLTIACTKSGFHWCDRNRWCHFCAVCYSSIRTLSLAVLFLSDADIQCALLLRHVNSCICQGGNETCAVACIKKTQCDVHVQNLCCL